MSTIRKEELTELAQRCLAVVASKQTELESTKLRLEGAAEGISFLLNSITEVLDAQEKTGGKDNKPFLATTKA